MKDLFRQDSMSFTCCHLFTYSFIILVSLVHSHTCKPFLVKYTYLQHIPVVQHIKLLLLVHKTKASFEEESYLEKMALCAKWL